MQGHGAEVPAQRAEGMARRQQHAPARVKCAWVYIFVHASVGMAVCEHANSGSAQHYMSVSTVVQKVHQLKSRNVVCMSVSQQGVCLLPKDSQISYGRQGTAHLRRDSECSSAQILRFRGPAEPHQAAVHFGRVHHSVRDADDRKGQLGGVGVKLGVKNLHAENTHRLYPTTRPYPVHFYKHTHGSLYSQIRQVLHNNQREQIYRPWRQGKKCDKPCSHFGGVVRAGVGDTQLFQHYHRNFLQESLVLGGSLMIPSSPEVQQHVHKQHKHR